MFEHGTAVLLVDPAEEQDLAATAREILSEWGPVYEGSPAGDVSVTDFLAIQAYAVRCHHPCVITFVDPREVDSSERLQIGSTEHIVLASHGRGTRDLNVRNPEHLQIGLHGRAKRDRDAHDLQIVHVEDKRTMWLPTAWVFHQGMNWLTGAIVGRT